MAEMCVEGRGLSGQVESCVFYRLTSGTIRH